MHLPEAYLSSYLYFMRRVNCGKCGVRVNLPFYKIHLN